jgi:chromosome segregation ATPase
MATVTGKTRCLICQKEKTTSKCSGCLEDFCFNHLVEHRQQLGKQFDELDYERNIFRQTLTEQITNPQKHSLMQQINQWEKDSINKIQQTAEEGRQILLKHTGEHFNEIEIKLTKLTEELKEIREENDFNEVDLNKFKQKLKELEEQLNKPSNISIRQDSSLFINKISVLISSGECL